MQLTKQAKYKNPYERHRCRIVSEIISKLQLQNTGIALDVGCGIGFYSALLANKGYTVIGIDINKIDLNYGTKPFQGDLNLERLS